MYKKLVFYWSPCLDKVGTVKSTLNSAASLNKFSKQNFEVCIINSCGEWNEYDKFFLKNDIKVINLGFNYFKYLPKKGYIQSRFSYFLVFLISFFPLMKILQIKKPDFLIAHLITSLPLSLMQIFNFRTKFILRISGMPKLNFFRKLFWRVLRKKIFLVTAPTLESRESLIKKKIFDSQKIKFLPDAIIDPNYLIKKNINHIFKKFNKKKIIFSAGRLTKQKNFLYLIEEFKNFLKVNDQYILILLGEGEEKEKLKKKVINEKL
jgi:glycosyltransferase involved in cell wall biosynthesis